MYFKKGNSNTPMLHVISGILNFYNQQHLLLFEINWILNP